MDKPVLLKAATRSKKYDFFEDDEWSRISTHKYRSHLTQHSKFNATRLALT